MNLNMEKSTRYTVPELYNIELETVRYLAEPLLQVTDSESSSSSSLKDVDILNTHVSVANQLDDESSSSSSSSGNRIILNLVVAIIYIAPAPQLPDDAAVDLSILLATVVDPHQLAMALGVPSLSATYGPKDATVVLNDDYDESASSSSSTTKSAADKGLIATTVFLAIGLATLAVVVLYVNGASCTSCKDWCINCLFEEVAVSPDGEDVDEQNDDRDYDDLDKQKSKNNSNNNDNKSNKDHHHRRRSSSPANFQVDSAPAIFHQADTYDEESVSMSSISLAMQTNPSGILGANHVLDDNQINSNSNPAAGLGIKTPVRGGGGGHASSEYDSQMLETPMSQQQPLGITSIRKMPQQAQHQQQQPQQQQQQELHQYYHHKPQQQLQQQRSDAASSVQGGDSNNGTGAGGGLVNMIMQRLNLNDNCSNKQ
jgi:hypothetical protein